MSLDDITSTVDIGRLQDLAGESAKIGMGIICSSIHSLLLMIELFRLLIDTFVVVLSTLMGISNNAKSEPPDSKPFAAYPVSSNAKGKQKFWET